MYTTDVLALLTIGYGKYNNFDDCCVDELPKYLQNFNSTPRVDIWF